MTVSLQVVSQFTVPTNVNLIFVSQLIELITNIHE